jgi:hypothetical protein
MLRVRSLLFVPLALMFTVAQAHAVTIFTATLLGSNENPPNNSTATGTASFVLNDAMTELSMSVTINGIDITGTQTSDPLDNLMAAHIHALAPGAPLTANGGVVWGFFGMPFNDTIAPTIVVTPFVSGVGGTFVSTWNAMEGNNTTLLAQLENLHASRTYINFHTGEFPGGEIRGAITPIPEPATLTLLGLGLIALGRQRLTRRRDAS